MNINTIRFIDRVLGNFLITLFIPFWKPKNKLKNDPKKILVLKIFGMGSVILCSKAFRALRERYPEAKIDLYTAKSNRQLYENNSLFNEIHTLDLGKNFYSFWEMIKNVYSLRSKKYDLVLDFEPLAQSSAIFTRLINPKRSIGYDLGISKRKYLFSDSVFYIEKGHVSTLFLDLLKPLGIRRSFDLEAPKPTEKEIKKVQEFLSKYKIKKYICININASELSLQRRWGLVRFRDLSRKILEDFPQYYQLFVGGPKDRQYVQKCIGGIDNPKIINLAGAFNLRELVILLKNSKVFISNDSGPLHLSATVNVPVICFFGPETPTLYGPLNHKKKVFYKGLSCSPCINIRNAKKVNCKNPVCLDFSVEEVFKEVKNFLKN